MALHFTEQEFEFRKNKIVKSMKEKNLDALFIISSGIDVLVNRIRYFWICFFSMLSININRKYNFTNKSPRFTAELKTHLI